MKAHHAIKLIANALFESPRPAACRTIYRFIHAPEKTLLMTPLENLARLGIALPPVSVPAAAYVPFVQSGRQIWQIGRAHV